MLQMSQARWLCPTLPYSCKSVRYRRETPPTSLNICARCELSLRHRMMQRNLSFWMPNTSRLWHMLGKVVHQFCIVQCNSWIVGAVPFLVQKYQTLHVLEMIALTHFIGILYFSCSIGNDYKMHKYSVWVICHVRGRNISCFEKSSCWAKFTSNSHPTTGH